MGRLRRLRHTSVPDHKSTLLEISRGILRQNKIGCMVACQFPGVSAWDGDDTEVMRTHDDVHGEGGHILIHQFESAVWSQDKSKYQDRAH